MSNAFSARLEFEVINDVLLFDRPNDRDYPTAVNHFELHQKYPLEDRNHLGYITNRSNGAIPEYNGLKAVDGAILGDSMVKSVGPDLVFERGPFSDNVADYDYTTNTEYHSNYYDVWGDGLKKNISGPSKVEQREAILLKYNGLIEDANSRVDETHRLQKQRQADNYLLIADPAMYSSINSQKLQDKMLREQEAGNRLARAQIEERQVRRVQEGERLRQQPAQIPEFGDEVDVKETGRRLESEIMLNRMSPSQLQERMDELNVREHNMIENLNFPNMRVLFSRLFDQGVGAQISPRLEVEVREELSGIVQEEAYIDNLVIHLQNQAAAQTPEEMLESKQDCVLQIILEEVPIEQLNQYDAEDVKQVVDETADAGIDVRQTVSEIRRLFEVEEKKQMEEKTPEPGMDIAEARLQEVIPFLTGGQHEDQAELFNQLRASFPDIVSKMKLGKSGAIKSFEDAVAGTLLTEEVLVEMASLRHSLLSELEGDPKFVIKKRKIDAVVSEAAGLLLMKGLINEGNLLEFQDENVIEKIIVESNRLQVVRGKANSRIKRYRNAQHRLLN